MWPLPNRKLIKTPANEIFSLFKPLQSGRTNFVPEQNLYPLFGCFIRKPISRGPAGKIGNVQKKYAKHEILTYLLTRAKNSIKTKKLKSINRKKLLIDFMRKFCIQKYLRRVYTYIDLTCMQVESLHTYYLHATLCLHVQIYLHSSFYWHK